jgi:tetratricopeptide (TPR) repeat protein
MAVLRFENLTSDVSLDWMGRAASEIISRELAGGKTGAISPSALHANPLAQQRPLDAPGESAERSAAIAEGATRLLIGQISRAGNRLELDVTERDPATNKTVNHFVVGTPNINDLFSLADAAARQFSSQVAPFGTRNNDAIAAWSRALEETDYSKAGEDYSHAVLADAGFATAWLDWASTATQHGDRATAAHVLELAAQHAGQFSDLERARLKLVSAQFTGNRAAILAALNDLGRLTPDDPSTIAAIAQSNYQARQYPAAVAAYRRLTQLVPNNGLAWNQLGYALMGSGDYDGAISALKTYQRLLPKDANPIDSQGDVAFAFGRFAEAEKLYDQATAADPAFANSAPLYKAAFARLMTGDVPGADKKLEAWVTARRAAKDPSVDLHKAEWLFISGRHPQALSLLASLESGVAPQMKAVILTQTAIWDLQLGARDRALQASDAALKTGTITAPMLIARFASEDGRSPADWSARADRAFAAPQVAQLKPVALAYALYLAHQWEAAEPLWKDLERQANAEDLITPVIYGQILVELKRPHDAEPFVRLFPIPNPQAIREFLSLAIPQIFETRAIVLANEASQKVFKTLSGTGIMAR